MRTFEACGVGALQLVDRADVSRLYDPGTEVAVSTASTSGRARPARRGRPCVGGRASGARGAARTLRRAHLRPTAHGPGVPVDGLTPPPRPRGLAPVAARPAPAAPAGRPGDPRAPLHRAPGRPPRCRDADPRRPRPGAGCSSASSRAPPARCSPSWPRCASSPSRESPSCRRSPSRTCCPPGCGASRRRPSSRTCRGWRRRPPPSSLPGTTSRLGRAARASVEEPARFVTAQHGLLTPYAPPLAEGTTLLAWSEADADFWRSGRDDVADRSPSARSCCGRPASAAACHGRPGRCPGLPRPAARGRAAHASCRRAAEAFCRESGAIYRPHPSERDRRLSGAHTRRRGRGDHRRPVRHARCASSAPGRERLLHRGARGRRARPARLGRLPRRAAVAAGVLAALRHAPAGEAPDARPRRPAVEPARRAASVLEEMMSP